MTGMTRWAWLGVVVAAGLATPRRVGADDVTYTLRLATVAPDGSQLAHGLRLFGQDVAAATDGKVKLKWYYNGVAGDELEQGERPNR